MRHSAIVLFLVGIATGVELSTSLVCAIPPLSSQRIYDFSEIILVGKVISTNSTFSPTHILYKIEVEQPIKNQIKTDTVLAAGQNTVIPRIGNQVFKLGDRALFFLNNDTVGYDVYTGIFRVLPESRLVEPPWDSCDIFEKNIPREHWVIGGRGPMPKISQENNTDVDDFVMGKEVLITYDVVNYTPDKQTVGVGMQVSNLDDPDSLYVFTEISQQSLEPCTQYKTMSWDFTPNKPGHYSAELYDLKGSKITMSFTVKKPVSDDLHAGSPLKQLRSGIPADQIKCKEGYELAIKSVGSSPACVKPETKAKLFERKWTTMAVIGGEISRLCYRDPNPGVCKAAIEKYYFDGNTNSCKPFTWGGCGGSVPFDTMNLCQMLCE